MPETESRTQAVRGRSPPDRPEWTVSTVAKRGTNRSETATCSVTGADVALDESHFYVTLRKETASTIRPDEYDSLIVADGAFGELEQWLVSE